jgi:hypothetical protein
MDEVLRKFLTRLEEIEEDHEGLGETNIRDHMGEDILNGFLRMTPSFVPSGEYGLDPEANELVAEAIARFVAAACAAAKRQGLVTFQQRLAAFQNDDVRTANGSDYNDFFGCKEADWFDADGNDLR